MGILLPTCRYYWVVVENMDANSKRQSDTVLRMKVRPGVAVRYGGQTRYVRSLNDIDGGNS